MSYSRGISEGNYIANLHLYREDLSPFKPINAKLVVSVVEPDSNQRKQILLSNKILSKVGEELTIFQFTLDKKGNLDKNSINNKFVKLRSGNKD